VEVVMTNNWTKEEIRLTRYAWYLHDMDALDKRRDKFVRVGLLTGLCISCIVIMGVMIGG
jgi:hypothetical protein